jgi:hypothetical protein
MAPLFCLTGAKVGKVLNTPNLLREKYQEILKSK